MDKFRKKIISIVAFLLMVGVSDSSAIRHRRGYTPKVGGNQAITKTQEEQDKELFLGKTKSFADTTFKVTYQKNAFYYGIMKIINDMEADKEKKGWQTKNNAKIDYTKDPKDYFVGKGNNAVIVAYNDKKCLRINTRSEGKTDNTRKQMVPKDVFVPNVANRKADAEISKKFYGVAGEIKAKEDEPKSIRRRYLAQKDKNKSEEKSKHQNRWIDLGKLTSAPVGLKSPFDNQMISGCVYLMERYGVDGGRLDEWQNNIISRLIKTLMKLSSNKETIDELILNLHMYVYTSELKLISAINGLKLVHGKLLAHGDCKEENLLLNVNDDSDLDYPVYFVLIDPKMPVYYKSEKEYDKNQGFPTEEDFEDVENGKCVECDDCKKKRLVSCRCVKQYALNNWVKNDMQTLGSSVVTFKPGDAAVQCLISDSTKNGDKSYFKFIDTLCQDNKDYQNIISGLRDRMQNLKSLCDILSESNNLTARNLESESHKNIKELLNKVELSNKNDTKIKNYIKKQDKEMFSDEQKYQRYMKNGIKQGKYKTNQYNINFIQIN